MRHKLSHAQEDALVTFAFGLKHYKRLTTSRKERKAKLKDRLAISRLWRRTPRDVRDSLFIKVMLRVMYPRRSN